MKLCISENYYTTTPQTVLRIKIVATIIKTLIIRMIKVLVIFGLYFLKFFKTIILQLCVRKVVVFNIL